MKTSAGHLTQTRIKWNLPVIVMSFSMALALCCIGAIAQSGAGAIQGTVTDSTGAVIPGATVHVVNQATSVAASTKANGVGFYQVPSLFTGTYVVTVTAPGMKTYKTTVELQVAQAAVINPSLTAGAVTQQVEVAANVVQLTTTDNGTISSTLENDRINQLPMNGRLLLTLAGNTTPGLEGTGTRANGMMAEALEYVQDGAPMANRNFGGMGGGSGTQGQLPDPDAVQEVRMETTNTSAMYATPATGIITTKSGTNGLHGSFFETARNNAVGIARARQNPTNYAAPHLVRNEFGASAGGPVILPKVYSGREKTFWFFAYERFSLATTTNELVTVPTNAMRGGDFSGLINSSGVLQKLFDPSTTVSSTNCPATGAANPYCRTLFTNNQIPIGRLAPATKLLYAITPTQTSADDPLVASNFTAPNATYQTVPNVTFRLDHSFSENNKAYLRYTNIIQQARALRNYPTNSPQTIAAGSFPAGASGYAVAPIGTFSAAIGYTHVFSPTFFSETIASQQWEQQYQGGGGNPNLNYEQMLGLPNNFGETGFPNMGPTLIMPYGGTQYQFTLSQIISNLDENMTKTAGRHQMQFGGRYRHERFGYLPDRFSDEEDFAAAATALYNTATGASYGPYANTGYADADFFLGAAYNYTAKSQPPYMHFHDMEFDGYFQDNFHLSRNLTLNLGFRYEAHPAPWTKYGLIEGFDLRNKAIVLPNPPSYYVTNGYTTQTIITNLQNIGVVFENPSQAGYPSALVQDENFTFGPRVGLAYTPFSGKYGTVVRGAYGRYIYPIPTRSTIKNTLGVQPIATSYSQSYLAANQAPDSLPNYILRAPQSVIMGQNSSGVVNSSTTNSILPGFGLWNMNPDYPPDYVTQTNFTIEQPLKGNSVLRLSWLWSHGTNLDHYYYYNNHPSTYVWEINTGTALPSGSTIGSNTYAATATGPYDQTTYGSGTWDEKTGWSNHNALQVNYQRLFRRGIAYQMGYVWSKSFRVGGNYFRDSLIAPAQNYPYASLGTMTSPYGTVIAGALPPARPAGVASYMGWHGLERFEEYKIDSGIPPQHIFFNGLVDLPLGRGKRFLGNSNRFMDELVGGWQVAGDGNITTFPFQPASSGWGPTSPLKVYKHNARITDCRSGVCHGAFEWFNGYLAPTVVNATTKGVSGLPSDWTPYSTPVDNTPGTTNYGTNNVLVTLASGATQTVAYSPGPYGNHPYSKTFLNGPFNWTIDLSLFKVFPVTEKVNLRMNVDAFNALNVQGYNNPNATDGTESLLSSYNTPRQLQFTLRLTF